RHLFAVAQGAHRLHHRSDRGRDVDPCGRATPVPRGRESQERDRDVHQLAGWRSYAIYDTMQFIRPPVSTLCVGQAGSMGSLLLGIIIHQPSGGFEGQATDIMLHAQEILNLKKRLNEIYVKHTGQPLRKIEDALERDTFLTADMAKDFGLVDKVI